jgi:hypothetical protein
MMHLSFVIVGAALAPTLHADRLAWTLIAFFLAMGLAAHALDEIKGRPLNTAIPASILTLVATLALSAAAALGVWAFLHYDLAMGLVFVPVGVLLVIAYNLELFGGRLHNDLAFAAAWGAFPALVAYYAQTGEITLVALFAGTYALAASHLQRILSTEARRLRRNAFTITGSITHKDGRTEPIDRRRLLATPESALRVLVVMTLIVAGMLAVAHL